MKISKRDLPKKNFTDQNFLFSICKAINKKLEGNFKDCLLKTNEELGDYLNALVKTGVIIMRENCHKEEYNLKNYICLTNPEIFRHKSAFVTWIVNNVVPLLTLALSSYALAR